MKRIIYIIIFIFLTIGVFSQQIPQLSLRHKCYEFFNPAASAINDYTSIKLLHRQQWVGFDNAPRTSFISYLMPFQKVHGISGFLINDKTLPTNRFTINLSYAYVIPMDNIKLSFGLSALIMQYKIDFSQLNHREASDPVYEFTNNSKWRPESNAGIMLYSDDFYFGFSINQIIKSSFRPFSENENTEIRMSRHFVVSGQYHFYVDIHRFSPGIFLSYARSSPFVTEISMYYTYARKINAALNYKLNDGLNLMLGYNYDRFGIYYSYDLVLSSLRTHTSGSHEVMLSIILNDKNQNAVPMFR